MRLVTWKMKEWWKWFRVKSPGELIAFKFQCCDKNRIQNYLMRQYRNVTMINIAKLFLEMKDHGNNESLGEKEEKTG